MPRGRKRNISDQNIPESDMILNSKNLEVLMPAQFDPSVAVNSKPLCDEKNPSEFINPVTILQLFHDQNTRIKLLEDRLEQQQQQIKNQQENLEKQRTDIEIQQQDIAIHQLEMVGKQKEQIESEKNQKKITHSDEMARRTEDDDSNFQKFLLKRVTNCENSVAEFETKIETLESNLGNPTQGWDWESNLGNPTQGWDWENRFSENQRPKKN